MKLFGHEFGKHEEPKPAEVAATEIPAETAPVEASADFAIPTNETETPVTDDAVNKAMGDVAGKLLDTTEAEANGTMDVAPATTPEIPLADAAMETIDNLPTADTKEDRYANMQPMAAKDAVLEGAMTDAPEMHNEIKEAAAAGELDTAPEAPTASDEAIIEGLNLPVAGSEEGEAALISTDTSAPSLGKEVDELNNLEMNSVLAPEEHMSVPVTTNEELVAALNLPEAGSAEGVAALEETATEAPVVDAELPTESEQTPEQQQ